MHKSGSLTDYAWRIGVKKAKRVKKRLISAEVIAAVRVFGGYAMIVTRRGKVAYTSVLMEDFSIGKSGKTAIMRNGRLVHPDLLAMVDEAWRCDEPITRAYQLPQTSVLREVVVHAGRIDDRWMLLAIVDRTAEVEAARVRRDFVSNTGHELRTPVTSIALIAQALHSAKDDPTAVADFADRLTNVAKRLENLTDSMLMLAKMQSETQLRQKPVPISEVVELAVARMSDTAESLGIGLKLKKPVSGEVMGNKAALVTAVENLIANALHYSPKDSRVLVATTCDEAEDTVLIAVMDSGIGIAAGEQEKVFERFYRTDEARNARSGGTGLGLSIVKHTALSHGGSVRLDSLAGVGSTFTIILPLSKQSKESENV